MDLIFRVGLLRGSGPSPVQLSMGLCMPTPSFFSTHNQGIPEAGLSFQISEPHKLHEGQQFYPYKDDLVVILIYLIYIQGLYCLEEVNQHYLVSMWLWMSLDALGTQLFVLYFLWNRVIGRTWWHHVWKGFISCNMLYQEVNVRPISKLCGVWGKSTNKDHLPQVSIFKRYEILKQKV